ncbi:nuclear pore complex component-domain-containing protein [Phaeosphaeriaceae sp. PMI808]|nr:nuclear pore complex component-domain-containing protein [Phaeosphaeriaceae sp. PMI808]
MSFSRSTTRAPATPTTPSTPAAQSAQPYTPNGAWKHPKFDEIARRQHATAFDERNVRAIVANAGLLFLSLYGSTFISKVKVIEYAALPVTTVINAVVTTVPYSEWLFVIVRLAFVANIAIALGPLFRRYYPDDIADIPLTPSQRASMGLKAGLLSPQTPSSAYASPNYVTPPRYQRSTPRSSSFSNHDSPSHSPAFSPSTSTGSPLFQKALGASTTKRLSYGGGTPMGSSLFGDSSASTTPGTPTPSTGKASVGLNNKWLYEKRRENPKSNLFT